ncbi:BPSL0761 family protein [Hydrogenophaga sp. SL48]|uniref:BPSL0761 family protein n=1 Tax=Hydrogenophaga sp. SL48 TaxID=2806347 RepID=UPI003FA55925
MTTPVERTRALRFAGEVLRELLAREDVPADVKQQVRVTLRHYPDAPTIKEMAHESASSPTPFHGYLAPEDSA